MYELIDRLAASQRLELQEYECLINAFNVDYAQYIAYKADKVRRSIYGTDVYIRGLIEVSNVCRNDCYYCGIRRSNSNCERYMLDTDSIMRCCAEGYELGFRTFVLQGGEGSFKNICDTVASIEVAIKIVPSHYRLENIAGQSIRICMTQAQIDIFYATKQLMKSTIIGYIQSRSHFKIV